MAQRQHPCHERTTNGWTGRRLIIKQKNALKTGKTKAVRFSRLNGICEALECQPADILKSQKHNKL
ncbi:helix-turn-helix domain-containing protein [Fodinibius sp. SL11]|uniref:helix-turn-helix domain-containing protein n=1 Tax=Fodinibius sp. SL11 TaxID=3425690 RepID=UPI003F88581C